MPRTYKKKVGGRLVNTATPEKMTAAVDALKNRGWSIRRASNEFGVKRSTLSDHVKGHHTGKYSGQTSLASDVEDMLVQRLILCASWGIPVTLTDLREIVKAYLDRRGIRVKRFKDNLPGLEWAKSFMKRHSRFLSERLSQNIKLARAEVGTQMINSYFDNLKTAIDGVPASHIVNYDETNLTDDPGRKRVVVKRGCKYPERVQNSSKSSTSLMLAAAGDGTVLPYYVVYKAKHLYDTWTNGGPDRCRYNLSKSGWFDNTCFEDCFTKVVLSYMRRLDGKKVLIGDNLSSHVSAYVVEKCEQENISFVLLPPNSTHLTQPLDVAFFRPMKICWRQILDAWKMTTEGRRCPSIPKDTFPKLLNQLDQKLQPTQAANVQSGFRKCGIIPHDPTPVLTRLSQEQVDVPAQEQGTGNQPQPSTANVDSAFIQVLQEMRGLDSQQPKKRAKRLQVSPGKSISPGDIAGAKGHTEQQTESSDDNDDEMEGGDTDKESEIEQLENDTDKESEIEQLKGGDTDKESEIKQLEGDDTDKSTDSDEVRNDSDVKAGNDKLTGVKPVNRIGTLQNGQWVLVRYRYRQKSNRLYVASDEQTYCEDDDLEVSFLRRKGTKSNLFSFPEQEDKALIDFDQIVGTLNEPMKLRRGLLRFEVDANEWM